MSLIIESCDTSRHIKEFVALPFSLYKNNPYWVPPLKTQERNALTAGKNPGIENGDSQFWIVRLDGRVVGRTGVIINPRYNARTGIDLCRLTRTEFIDDIRVSRLLLETAENWAASKGMKGIHGPLGFTNLDHQGILVEGFDHLPSIASEYHLPYYLDHFTRAGYQKEMDWVEFRLTLDKAIPEKAVRLAEMIRQRYKLNIIHFKEKKQLVDYGSRIFSLLNVSFAELFSFVPLQEEMSVYYTRKYLNLLHPAFVKAVEDQEGQTIAFIISMPSLSKAMQKINGNLFPFGFMQVMKAMKKPEVVDLLLTAIHPDWQAQGIIALLITELQKVMYAHGVEYIETTGMLETNDKAINHWKNYDHIQHKRKRCFIKMF